MTNIIYRFRLPAGYCLLVLLILTSTMAMVCEPRLGSIEGRVFGEDGTPLASAPIIAEKEGPGVFLRTDDQGYYEIKRVDTGTWRVEFYDLQGWLVGLETVVVRANEATMLNFTVGENPLPDDFFRGRLIFP